MMALPRYVLPILIALGMAATPPPALPAVSQPFAQIEKNVRRALPSTRIDAIRPSPVPGLAEVVAGHNVFYADTSGRWLLLGHLYDLKTATDVTAQRQEALNRITWSALPLATAVHYGSGPLKLAIFSDPHCPWCRKLHKALHTARGIEVYEIMFPVEALHPGTHDDAVRILCHPHPAAALTRVMANRPLRYTASDPACVARAEHTLAQAKAFAQAHGIQGTPTLIAGDGRVHNGYMPLAALKQWLAAAPRQAHR